MIGHAPPRPTHRYGKDTEVRRVRAPEGGHRPVPGARGGRATVRDGPAGERGGGPERGGHRLRAQPGTRARGQRRHRADRVPGGVRARGVEAVRGSPSPEDVQRVEPEERRASVRNEVRVVGQGGERGAEEGLHGGGASRHPQPRLPPRLRVASSACGLPDSLHPEPARPPAPEEHGGVHQGGEGGPEGGGGPLPSPEVEGGRGWECWTWWRAGRC
jgi:hypothetical protein